MNQSQMNNFLLCLSKIDDSTYKGLHNGLTLIGKQQQHEDHEDHDHDHNHDEDHSSSDNLLIAKATAMAVLFCATTICGLIPFLLNRHYKWTTTAGAENNNNSNARSATTVKCLLYFGGGVLLCTTFMHLLPEVQETINLLEECGQIPHLHFSLAQLLTCLGFFAMFLIEEIIHAYIHRERNYNGDDDVNLPVVAVAFERSHSLRNSYLKIRKSDGSGSGNGHHHHHHHMGISEISNGNGTTAVAVAGTTMIVNGGGGVGVSAAPTTLSVQNLLTNEISNQKYFMKNLSSSTPHDHEHNDLEKECTNYHHHHHQHHNGHHHHHHHHNHHHNHNGHSHLPLNSSTSADDDAVDADITSSLRGLLIVLALSLHELFEGMAIGLESSSNNVWFMFAAVSAHKFVLAFCVGIELLMARTRFTLSIVYVLTFGIVSPIGIGIGILISHRDDDGATAAANLPSAILQGLATGTLLYVVFFEILSKDRSGLLAYLAFFIGFVIMFGIQQMGGHEHSHSHACGPGDHSHHTGESLHIDHSHNHPDHNVHEDDSQMRTFEQQLKILREASKSLTEMLIKQKKNASII